MDDNGIDLMRKRIQACNIPVTLFFLACCGLAVFLLLFRPIPRQIGLTFRNTLYVFPLLFLTAFFCGNLRNLWLKALLSAILFAFVLLPYSGLINSGMSDQYALGGVIPWSDAFTMQLNTQRFLYGGTMGQTTALRPLSTVFYGLFLHISGSNYFALQVFLCILTAFCMLSAMESVFRSFGTVCGAMFFTVLYFYIRQRLGTFMTEPYGFLCGLLSCQLILTGLRDHRQPPMLAGFLFLSIGLNARPAAMLLFPALGLWYFFVFVKDHPKRFFLSAAALAVMLSGFGLNRIAQKAVYGDRSIPNRQAAEMVYGLCLGGESWGSVASLPEITALNRSDNVLRDVAALCAPVLREHPENLISALRTVYYDSLIRSEYYGAFSFISGNPQALRIPVRYGMMAIWLAGVILLFHKKNDPSCSMLMVSVLGIILSEMAAVPFSTNYLRLYAVSMWVPACVCGMFPQLIFEKIFTNAKLSPPGILFSPSAIPSGIMGILILIGAVFGAVFLKAHPFERPSAAEGICKAGESSLITSVDPGSFIYLSDNSDLEAEHIPYFRLPYVRQHFHDTASVEMFGFTDAIETPTAIIRGIDLGNLKDVLIFAPLDMVEGKTGIVQFCGEFLDPPILRNDRFFIPSSAIEIREDL